MDGITTNDKYTHTLKDETDNWWSVKFTKPIYVGLVKIYNRRDCCGYRLTNSLVNVFNNDRLDNSRLCNTIPDTTGVLVIDVSCTRALIGQGVEIANQESVLHMVEVEVYSAEVYVEQ